MIDLLFCEINYLPFAGIFIRYLILIEIAGSSQSVTVQCLYLLFLILQLRHSYYAYLRTQVEIDIARVFDNDERNLVTLRIFVKYIPSLSLIERPFSFAILTNVSEE